MKRIELLKTIALIAAIIVVTVGSSVVLNLYTGPKIEENKLAAASGALSAVLPEGKAFEDITATLTIDANSGVTEVHKETNGAGYVFMATAQGFSKPVNVTVGVSADGKIAGINVVIGEGDFGVDNMIPTFVGQDSTLSGVVVHTGATISSNAVKTAVTNGLTVLALNNLMQAAQKSAEQVFEELLPTVYNGFVKGDDLTVSGNISVAYKAKNGSGVVAYVTSGEQTLLALCNVSGVVALYQPKLIDEATQVYELEAVENDAVATEVSTFAASQMTSSFATLEGKISRMYETATEVTEVSMTTFGTALAAATFTVDGATYYATYSKAINAYNGSLMTVYVVLDSTGKVAKVDFAEIFGDEEYFHVAGELNQNSYKDGFVGKGNEEVETGFTTGGNLQISGATLTSNGFAAAFKDAFAIYNSTQGGNE